MKIKYLNELLIGLLITGLFTLMLVFHYSEVNQAKKINPEYLQPTAGIIYYMSRLEYHTMQGAKAGNIDEDENKITTVQTTDPEYDDREYLKRAFGYIPSDEELKEAIQMTMDEAGYTESDYGIALVFCVIANRCRNEQFPDTIHEVLYQRNQFQPVVDNTVGKFAITDRVRDICADQISEGLVNTEVLYFTAGQYNPYCEPMFREGAHYFGK